MACGPVARVTSRVTGVGVSIFMLHELHEAGAAGRLPPRRSMAVSDLEEVLCGIGRTHTFVSLDDALGMLSGQTRWRERCVVLTFDDSMKSAVSLAAPLLRRMGLPATFFVSTEAIDEQSPYWWVRLEYAVAAAPHRIAQLELGTGECFRLGGIGNENSLAAFRIALWDLPADERANVVAEVEAQLGASVKRAAADPLSQLLTWDDVRRLRDLGMGIGSHTVTHPNLSMCTAHEAQYELDTSRRRIEAELGVACREFCYPGGRFNAETVGCVRACGYRSAVTTREGSNERGCDVFLMKRWGMPRTARKAVRVVSGTGDVLGRVKGRLAAAM